MNSAGIAKAIEKMLDLLDSPEKWHKGTNFKDQFGDPVEYDLSRAASYCLQGAAIKVCGEDYYQMVTCYLDSCTESQTGVVNFNDQATTTYEDVRLLLKTALYALDEEDSLLEEVGW